MDGLHLCQDYNVIAFFEYKVGIGNVTLVISYYASHKRVFGKPDAGKLGINYF